VSDEKNKPKNWSSPMIEPLVAQANVVIVFSAITGLVLALTTAGAIWVFFKVFDDYERNVRDVQRFIELTDEARSLVPPGLPLLHPERAAATADAIGRFQAKKHEARQALWQPRSRRHEPVPARDHARDEAIPPRPVGPVHMRSPVRS
jgi:hypothetical protein